MQKILKNIFPLLVIVFLFLNPAFSQRVKQLNLPAYDKEKLHFGFSLAVNKADFVLYPADVSEKPDSVLSTQSRPDWGFNLGIVSDLRLHDYLTIRFLPALTFQGRSIDYLIQPTGVSTPNSSFIINKKVESTLLDFPINLKLRSERLNNMSAYLLGGGKYSIDLASQAKTKNPDIVKLTGKDWSLEAGFGFDFYLSYFKLSTEIKFSAGFPDRLYHENTTYSAPINKLSTKVWLFSLNFEG